ncbi:MAG: pantetheine-phosphate adenylyltransferase [Bacteroidales bacterium]|nr:pantetheine-phosphate adenylyltransferase [Bacteroidales bacterium]
MRTALFAGTFDPITTGHEVIVRRAAKLFDAVVVAIGENTQKSALFSQEQRLDWLRRSFEDVPNVKVDHYKGLTTDYCRQHGIGFLLRGLRSTTDFLYEENIARINRAITPEIESVFLLSDPASCTISSSMLRELLLFGHRIDEFVPKAIRKDFLRDDLLERAGENDR